MTTTTHHLPITTTDEHLLIDHYLMLAERSATYRSWVDFRLRVLRRDRQAKFARAWGLR